MNYVSEKAKIGKNVQIEPFAVIYDDVVIGDNCYIGANVVIFPGARIGNNCRIFPGASIAAIPQDLKFDNEYTTVEIGDNNTIREFVTINRGTAASGKTVVGNNNLIMAYVHIAHDCVVGNNCVLANNTTLAGHITIEDYVITGGMSAIHQFVHVGQHSILAGGSLVDKDIPPFIKVGKFPASYCGINSVGLHRRGFSQEDINEIQAIYKIVFQSGLMYSKALEEVKSLKQTKYTNIIATFIEKADRGLIKGYS
ncbi:MAG: acyl-ACP--UDP-N-acetylglucosamine O-acyltransferase [Bacteroidales bacterium]|jgi:UDP-N-acetylglucosamine acyltransferase|nr:acyl-ACP--UDP-N-acetylglucosamine O-acyltransferase [Bacteroidales bacterium]MDY6393867.1 acyl-ACP--UDP-N-acetylglucosamine O-acyltransferase [Bacteroidales bacterium]MDY6423950.1 acyl-ACP--UDP-N-acetylglucosamine O-acyltransferase [Bacteroidales bacterium]MEE3412708.1 acyl-ACP--UDP-N-acetylglucosamine O-acyltransferase [Bacteroidales bacterium]